MCRAERAVKCRAVKCRRGYLYLAVLFASLVVATIAVGSLSVMYKTTLRASGGAERDRARVLADSAAAYGLATLNSDSSWRANYTHAVASDAIDYGGGTIQFQLMDDDGNLANDPADGVTLRGIGRFGEAVYVRSVDLTPAAGIDALQTAIAIDGSFSYTSDVYWNTDGTAAFNGDFDLSGSGSVFTGAVEHTGSGSSANLVGSRTVTTTPRQMPRPNWIDFYATHGTEIAINDIPYSGFYRVRDILLSPSSNPYGATNELGIYVIDCKNQRIEFDRCRIRATVVLINARSNSRVGPCVHWEPAIENFPALLVDDDFVFQLDDVPLDESAVAVNFNPDGLPYQGQADSDMLDSYPSRLRGLVFIDGRLTFASAGVSRIDGLVVAKRVRAQSHVTVTFRNHYQDQPPPGFRTGPQMRIEPGSWRRVAL